MSAPVDGWVDEIRRYRTRGSLLDAGCGTGRHAEALSKAGFEVELLDASPDLLAAAQKRNPELQAHLADICAMDVGRLFDVVACRGVLNDMLTDVERSSAIERLAAHVAPGGILMIDVRERSAARARAGALSTAEGVLADGRTFRFRSNTKWVDPLLLVSEQHETLSAGETTVIEPFDFAMRPWARSELAEALNSAGLEEVTIAAASYRPTGDRLVAIARQP